MTLNLNSEQLSDLFISEIDADVNFSYKSVAEDLQDLMHLYEKCYLIRICRFMCQPFH